MYQARIFQQSGNKLLVIPLGFGIMAEAIRFNGFRKNHTLKPFFKYDISTLRRHN